MAAKRGARAVTEIGQLQVNQFMIPYSGPLMLLEFAADTGNG